MSTQTLFTGSTISDISAAVVRAENRAAWIASGEEEISDELIRETDNRIDQERY